MSFRNRLTLLFVIIVMIPMIVVAAILFNVLAEVEQTKRDVKLEQAQQAAAALYDEFRDHSERSIRVVASDKALIAAIGNGDRSATRERLNELAKHEGLRYLQLTSVKTGSAAKVGTVSFGAPPVVADSVSSITSSQGKRLASVKAAVVTAASYTTLVKEFTGLEVIVADEGSPPLASTLTERSPKQLPTQGDVNLAKNTYRILGFPVNGVPGGALDVYLLALHSTKEAGVLGPTIILGLALVFFVVVALSFAILVSRSLRRQIQRLLDAARALAKGNFSLRVPEDSNDEFAELGSEFNAMARQLEVKMIELRQQRERLQEAIRLTGESFGRGLERNAIIDIVLKAICDGLTGRYAVASIGEIDSEKRGVDIENRDADPGIDEGVEQGGAPVTENPASISTETDTKETPPTEVVPVSPLDFEELASIGGSKLHDSPRSRTTEFEVMQIGDIGSLSDVVAVAEERADSDHVVEEIQNSGVAIARYIDIGQDRKQRLKIVVARDERQFSAEERELFSYLVGQAAVSLENIELHETIQRQAITDELTGLYNQRHFEAMLSTEVERSRRFDQPLALIIVDIDGFKQVNDTYGHLQGDRVLREVAGILRASTREIDESARYGGDELVIGLPQTDLAGAHQFAERIRERIEALKVPIIESTGTLTVTASLGVAAGQGEKLEKNALFATADAALYRAKRSGKNRTQNSQLEEV